MMSVSWGWGDQELLFHDLGVPGVGLPWGMKGGSDFPPCSCSPDAAHCNGNPCMCLPWTHCTCAGAGACALLGGAGDGAVAGGRFSTDVGHRPGVHDPRKSLLAAQQGDHGKLPGMCPEGNQEASSQGSIPVCLVSSLELLQLNEEAIGSSVGSFQEPRAGQ